MIPNTNFLPGIRAAQTYIRDRALTLINYLCARHAYTNAAYIHARLSAIINPRRACEGCGSRFFCLCVCVCVFGCPIEILRTAALSIELSHVLCIKSNYLKNGRVVCRKTLSFLRHSQSCSYWRFGLHGHAYKIMTTPIFISASFM